MSTCSGPVTLRGASLGRPVAPSSPDVGGLPSPTAVNRQPYDLVLVCVCACGHGQDGKG